MILKSKFVFDVALIAHVACCLVPLPSLLITRMCCCLMLRPPKPFKLRACKYGFGLECNEKKADTCGMELTDVPHIEISRSGFKKLRMPRNHSKAHQVSEDMLKSWRANCDVQILIYESDPEHPDLEELTAVTNYVVGYACKGGKTVQEEKDQTHNFIEK